jgi:hypothetical protein
MLQTNKIALKKDKVTIQFNLTNKEYTDIQRVKIELGKSRENNSDFYKELLLKGLNEIAL